MTFDPDQFFVPGSPIEEYEHFLLFSIAVAGKSSKQTAEALKRFYWQRPHGRFAESEGPFEFVRRLSIYGDLREQIEASKMGNYTKNEHAFREVAFSGWDLTRVTFGELLAVKGIGHKTAAFFIAHTRNESIAVLDTHVLKWLRVLGYFKAPKSTPGGDKYDFWSRVYLLECKKRGADPVDVDKAVWTHYNEKRPGPPPYSEFVA